jgi:plasmid stabilization system protein ParE
MKLSVEISVSAQKKIVAIFDYLDARWSERIRINFAKKLHTTFDVISSHPESFPKSEIQKSVYKCVLTKQTTIFYRFNSKKITIVSIFDTRQDPNKIKKIK